MISRLRSKCLVAAVGFAWATISGVSIGVAGSPPKKPPSVDIQAVIKSADEAARNDDFIEALRLYRQAAEKGDPRAQYEVGVMVQDGHFEEAVKWWRLAAAQGYAEAEYQLGSIYERGYGVPKDKNESMKWYKLAAAHGYAEAEYKLGMKKRPPKHAAAAPSVPLTTNSVESAYKLCAYFDATKLLSQKCSVSGWHSSVLAFFHAGALLLIEDGGFEFIRPSAEKGPSPPAIFSLTDRHPHLGVICVPRPS